MVIVALEIVMVVIVASLAMEIEVLKFGKAVVVPKPVVVVVPKPGEVTKGMKIEVGNLKPKIRRQPGDAK